FWRERTGSGAPRIERSTWAPAVRSAVPSLPMPGGSCQAHLRRWGPRAVTAAEKRGGAWRSVGQRGATDGMPQASWLAGRESPVSDSGPAPAETRRLAEAQARAAHWKRWGPYLAERQWGTVREDYSSHGTAWE